MRLSWLCVLSLLFIMLALNSCSWPIHAHPSLKHRRLVVSASHHLHDILACFQRHPPVAASLPLRCHRPLPAGPAAAAPHIPCKPWNRCCSWPSRAASTLRCWTTHRPACRPPASAAWPPSERQAQGLVAVAACLPTTPATRCTCTCRRTRCVRVWGGASLWYAPLQTHAALPPPRCYKLLRRLPHPRPLMQAGRQAPTLSYWCFSPSLSMQDIKDMQVGAAVLVL